MKKNVLLLLLLALAVISCKESMKQDDQITIRDIKVAEKLFGLEFSNAERDSTLRSVNQNLESFNAIQVNSLFQDYDVIIAPSFGGDQMLMTNLTGHPCLVMPNGINDKGSPASICLLGNLFDKGTLIEVTRHYQLATAFEDKHPPLFN